MSKVLPITPDQAEVMAGDEIPGFVIDTFNSLIKAKYSGGVVSFTQNEVVEGILKHAGAIECLVQRRDIFEKGWLNVEPVFTRAGWHVEYDKPGYNETYEARFYFRR